jgi:uncharacterized surface protein with fasciclin (FAS1) repeats
VVARDNLDATLAKNTDLSIFKAAIAQAKLETFTKGPGPFTLLAPTDAAFNAAGITAATLPSIDSIVLTALILNHFQNIARTSFEIPEGPNGPMTSIAGFSNYSYQNKALGKIFISGANVSEKDIKTSNGIIHKIDKVLFPPVLTILATLQANPDFSLFVQAVQKTSLTGTVSPATTAPVTVFALNNATMIANGYDATTIAALTGVPLTTLSNIIKYHVVANRNFSTDMKAGTLKTAYVIGVAPNTTPTYITISLGSGVFVKGNSNPTPFQLNPVDIAASNGVIQVSGGMLKP